MTPDEQQDDVLSQWMLRMCGGLLLLGVGMFGLFSSCGTLTEIPGSHHADFNITITEPQLERDLVEIQESGVLRILTRNNSSSYLIVRGEELGFEFELARDFAKELGVKLEVVLADSSSSMISMLNRGQGDLVAAPLSSSEALRQAAMLSRPYNELQPVLVVPREYLHLYRDVRDLNGRRVAARRWSSEQELIAKLRLSGIEVGMAQLQPDISTEELLDMVADGRYSAAVANSQVARAALTLRPELSIAFALGENQAVSWAVRKNSPALLDALDGFLDANYHIKENGQLARSALYNVLVNKYFKDDRQIQNRAENPFLVAKTGRISPYDELLQQAASANQLDWLLLAAICVQESSFDPELESWAGAVGLMQVMPKWHGVPADSLRVPEVNVAVGARYIRTLYDTYAYIEDAQRTKFVLAAYNAGPGHLDDARMLTIELQRDPNQWEGAVDESLLLLRRPEHHRKSRYGYVRGTETTAYVREVLRRYQLLRELTSRDTAQTVMRSYPTQTAFTAPPRTGTRSVDSDAGALRRP